eukprot:11958393-Ditylum_brightwellii.AAC.1
MIAIEAATISALPFQKRRYPTKVGRRVDTMALEEGEKESLLLSSGIWAVPVFSMSDKDITRTLSSYRAYHIMMATARHGHTLTEDV